LLFGHAVLQKLQAPYPAITAQVWVLKTQAKTQAKNQPLTLGEIDAALAASLSAQLTPQDLLPLPVLGIPQWWTGNEDAAFYDDARIFRPPAP
jgi:hypothetical protein